jgi:hypothetical protein
MKSGNIIWIILVIITIIIEILHLLVNQNSEIDILYNIVVPLFIIGAMVKWYFMTRS